MEGNYLIEDFENGRTYTTKKGNHTVLIHGVDNNTQKVRFVLNGGIQDMQSFDSFLRLMNTGEYSITDF